MEQVQDQGKAADAGRAEFPTDANGYKILCQIGVSEHSVVYKAICESVNSTTVAVKVVDMDGLDWDHVKNIINSLSLIQHPNILSPHCSFMVDRKLWIIMPFIHVGSLETLMAARFQNGLPDQFLAILLHQLLSGLACLHRLGYVHKDIKPSNIFVDSEGTVKLSDVNVFKPKTAASDEYSSSLPYWIAPELGRSDDEYSFKSDVWAIGIVALEIAYGCPPISGSRALMSQFLKISRRFPYGLNVDKIVSKNVVYRKFSLSDLFKDFVTCCLVKDPSKRASTMSLLTHSFIKKGERSNISNLLFKSIPKDMIGIEYSFQQSKDRLVSLMKNDFRDNDNNGGKSQIINSWDFNNFLLELELDETWEKRVVPLKNEGGSSEKGEPSRFGIKHVGSLSGQVEETHAKVLSSLQESFNKVITQFRTFLERRKFEDFQWDRIRTSDIQRLHGMLRENFEGEVKMRREIHKMEEGMQY